MKTNHLKLIIAFSSLFFYSSAFSQKAVFTSNKGMTIGFGTGISYQQSDIPNSMGAGFDFFLGSYLRKRENEFLAVDWKFRYLMGENRAHDHRINTDGTFSNIRYAFFNYDAELGLTLNRLLERTRIVITGFAGAGITHGRTFTDLYDENGSPYNYSVIDPNLSRREIYSRLLDLSDRDYETRLENRALIMPAAGIFFGYQFSKSFSMGIEHKINFSLTEKNSAFGIDMDNRVYNNSRIDMNHYTSLGFKWAMGGGGRARRTSIVSPAVTTTSTPRTEARPPRPVADPYPVITVNPPEVNIINPPGEQVSVTSGTIRVSARVYNVNNRQNIRVIHNGTGTAFDFDPATGMLNSTLTLSAGTNTLVITAANEAGTARDNTTVVFKPAATPTPPAVRFINPPSPVTVQANVFPLEAGTTNVKRWDDVTVKINGDITYNFSFSSTGIITTNIGLREGQNTVEISARNDAGTADEKTTITYNRPARISPPSIIIQSPPANPFTTEETTGRVTAIISGIKGKDNITAVINGANTSGFDFEPLSGSMAVSFPLKEGRNEATISARNEAGQDIKSAVIFKETRPCLPPSLILAEPSTNELITSSRTFTLRAEAKNITGKSQVTLNLNGKNIDSFNFNGRYILYNGTLDEGRNLLVLTLRNECSTEETSLSVTYNPPAPPEVEKPCNKPVLSFSLGRISDTGYELKGVAANVSDKKNITITVNGNPAEAFSFEPSTGEIKAEFSFSPGSYEVTVNAGNECGTDIKTRRITVEEPCYPPAAKLIVTAVEKDNITHEAKGTTENIINRNEVTFLVNNKPVTVFNFDAASGILTAGLSLQPGSNTVILTVKNRCGEATERVTITIAEKEKPCGIRINPGNSGWQFCLVTPAGTFNRDTLRRDTFSYSGSAQSLFFMPIAGGGDAVVNGKPFAVKPGQNYLFTGRLKVTVSTRNPGSMGYWSVCIESDREPVSGTGNNRPVSPCESENDNDKPSKPEGKPGGKQ